MDNAKQINWLKTALIGSALIVTILFGLEIPTQAASSGDVVINEIMQNPGAVLDLAGEWFELFNTTASDIDINGWTIADLGVDSHVIHNGGPLVIRAGGYLVLGNNVDTSSNGGVNVNYVYGSSWFLANSADEIILLDDSSPDPVEIDRVEYDGGPTFPDPTGASMALKNPSLDNNIGTNWCTSATPFGDGDLGTPGAANDCGVCGNPAIFIHEIQGSSDISPLNGVSGITIEGVVVGDFQDKVDNLGGFFLQEEDAEADGNPMTSEGIFVFDNGFGVDVKIGDVVRVTGSVNEYYGLTQINNVSKLMVCSADAGVSAGVIFLPVSNIDILERFEGMLVKIQSQLYVTDNYYQGRFGEVDLSINARLKAPTNIVAPGLPALTLQNLNDLSRIQLDDGSRIQHPDPTPYIGIGNTLRAGDTIPDLTGVLGYSYGTYEVHPTEEVNFVRINIRDLTPPDVGGTLKVVSYNLSNYFVTLDTMGDICGPSGNLDCRGADTADEFIRQRDKIIKAIEIIDADVIGLQEIENHPTDDALKDLINGLNSIAGSGTYDFIHTGPIGTDAIKVAFIYKPGIVTPAGSPAIIDSSVDPIFLDTKNRPSLAQTFEQNVCCRKLTIVINHFKSKGSSCDDVGDPDTGDGQGNCNNTRTDAAIAVVNWLATDPTGSNDPDYLIIGDLNAYAMEDPITAIKGAGYTDLIDSFVGSGAYSYVFSGQAGYLDHALANVNLVPQITGTVIWHIGADEPAALDYNDYNQPSLYNVDQYRASDHDPVIIGIGGCPGDFNNDGDVDGSDLAVFAADLGRTDCSSEPPCEGDFDSDGDVDGSDLATFAADFGRTDCPLVMSESK